MNSSKLHYLIALISYPTIILHFLFSDYESEKTVTGISFFSIATVIYLVFVYLYSKSDLGKKIVLFGLMLLGIVSVILAIVTV
ncbi:hypothetical protein ACKXGF_03235 [Alkalibacillus sp. S2W]|uniref:hypothetical protein n=1 Tax=Alkalibacillus sp. S2W TaxID=3386553 RepID=UPI00398D3D0E